MDASVGLLNKILDCTAMRQKVLAHNLANVNTPGYKRMDVEFRAALNAAIENPDIPGEKPMVVTDTASPGRFDGNNVSLQKELGEMNENALLFQFAARAINLKFDGLRKAARGRS